MQRIYSEQTTQIQYNRHLAAYYRQQIAALQKGLPRCPPQTPPAASEQYSIDSIGPIVIDDPTDTFNFPSQQETQHSTSSSSMGTCSPKDDDGDIIVTSRERTESYESHISTSTRSPDSAGSFHPARPIMASTGMGTGSSPVPVVKGVKSKARAKFGGKGLSRIFRRRRSGDD
ncbi:hypothetical protein LTR29_006691 [Friedmanniomyces endolithicus]|uniref:Uncharacterized protein n=2 Tax=Dothideomycetidae TaxID=451867 RepID=A0A4U0V670_9PEZI|nr:hypothetical protein LTS09_003478 [Friedmanniomyces endolithicus]KAK0941799.1 hypothetical protein LTR29_006691 [Friedmanniomyces endolithicus]KAK1814597.1 hypothetical protein LTR12_010983 [Friedmanniomyces endolithicus]KAK5140536.1 hypothetical protein LTR32_006689 [Rachicladosporium monterosium]TKA44260.1 hypothetical protein B0A54_05002 [Friedmanniomyces endolithicus]